MQVCVQYFYTHFVFPVPSVRQRVSGEILRRCGCNITEGNLNTVAQLQQQSLGATWWNIYQGFEDSGGFNYHLLNRHLIRFTAAPSALSLIVCSSLLLAATCFALCVLQDEQHGKVVLFSSVYSYSQTFDFTLLTVVYSTVQDTYVKFMAAKHKIDI